MNFIEINKNKVFEKKAWDYNRNKLCYQGFKVYICTKWDNCNKINLHNYGKIININETFVTVNVGKYKGFIDLMKTLTYSNNEIKYIFLLTKSNVNIKKEYYKIKNNDELNTQEKKELYKDLLVSNFNCI